MVKKMQKKKIKLWFAPIGVAMGISLFITIFIWITYFFQIDNFQQLLWFIPAWIIYTIGFVNLLLWLPIFILGFYYLRRKGAVGDSESLITRGIYQYVRNPMYIGISITIISIGLIINQTGLIIAGIFWFISCIFQSLREEKELEVRFGEEYINYKNSVPRLIPNFKLFIRNLFIKKKEVD